MMTTTATARLLLSADRAAMVASCQTEAPDAGVVAEDQAEIINQLKDLTRQGGGEGCNAAAFTTASLLVLDDNSL